MSDELHSSRPSRIAWLGLGSMGDLMARRLASEGRQLAVFDPNLSGSPGVAGWTAAKSPAEAAAGMDTVCVMVATPDQAERALFGSHGAVDTLLPDSRVLILSTVGVGWIESLVERLPAGVRVIDAPVSGGVTRAAEGSLLVMAAAALTDDVALLSTLGQVVHVGERPGQGQAMKMVNQVLCGVHLAAAAEALAFAESLGIEPALAWETVRRGAAASFMLEDRGARMLEHSPQPVRSAVSLFVKDLGLVLTDAEAAGQPLTVVAAAAELFTKTAESGRREHDDTALLDYLRSLRELRPAPEP